MHLVILAYVYFFWVRCHPSRTFLPKELEREPQNRLPFLPTAKPHPLIPLTHGPPPLYWLGIGRWCLSLMCMLHFCLNPLLFWPSCICHYLRIYLILLHVLVFVNSCSMNDTWAFGLSFTAFHLLFKLDIV